jgi:hypothetical protein
MRPWVSRFTRRQPLQIAIDNFDASRAGEQLGTVKTAIDVTKDASQLLQEKMDKFNLVLQP